jgi:hypothetical protein
MNRQCNRCEIAKEAASGAAALCLHCIEYSCKVSSMSLAPEKRFFCERGWYIQAIPLAIAKEQKWVVEQAAAQVVHAS